MMKTLGYYNGNYGPLEEMMVPMNDRVCYFGDGVYEATLAHNHKIAFLDEHVDRFFRSAGMIRIELPFTKEELKEKLYEMVEKVEGEHLLVYWQQTRGTAMRSHAFPKGDVPSNLWIMIKPAADRDYSKRIALTEMEDTRFLHCNIKTLNLIPSVMAAQKAEEEGCYECVFHRGEVVTECAHSNISILKDGVFRTHPNDRYILPGIAKAHLIKACETLHIPVDETAFTLTDLVQADEVIVSSSTNICSVADLWKGQPIGGKATALAEKIQNYVIDEFNEYCR